MDAPSNTSGSVELADYGALLRRRWRLVVGCLLGGLLVTGGYLVVVPKVYTATASVLVESTGAESAASSGGSSDTEINLDTEAQVAKSIVVAEKARSGLGSSTPADELLERVTVTVPPNSTVLDISYDAASPTGAQRGAQAFAQAYLQHRRETADATLQERTKTLRKQVQSLNQRLSNVSGDVATLPQGSSERALAVSQRDLLKTQIAELNSRIGQLTTTTITPGNVISSPTAPQSPSSPILPLYLASGLMAGLLAGVMSAVFRDRADTRIRRAADVERLVKLPVLTEVPGKHRQNEPALLPPRSRTGQAFHELTHSLNAALGHGTHVVLVTGASPGPGTSMVAANLAATLARTGSSTVLVCADLQSTTSPWMLGLQASPGLSDVLLPGTRISAAEQRPIEPSRLRVLAAGADIDVASEQLQTQAMERLISDLRQSATYIVMEAPSTSISADAQALADLADVALVVVEVPRAERFQVREAVRRLDRVGAMTLGAVVLPTLKEPHPPDPGEGQQVPTAPALQAGTGTAPMRLSPEEVAAAKAGRDPAQLDGLPDAPGAGAPGGVPPPGQPGPPSHDGSPGGDPTPGREPAPGMQHPMDPYRSEIFDSLRGIPAAPTGREDADDTRDAAGASADAGSEGAEPGPGGRSETDSGTGSGGNAGAGSDDGRPAPPPGRGSTRTPHTANPPSSTRTPDSSRGT